MREKRFNFSVESLKNDILTWFKNFCNFTKTSVSKTVYCIHCKNKPDYRSLVVKYPAVTIFVYKIAITDIISSSLRNPRLLKVQ